MARRPPRAKPETVAQPENEFDAGRVAELLKVLAHPARLSLLCRLHEGECSVSQLEDLTGIHQPSLSQHLAAFREADLVTTRREHKTVFYRLSNADAAALVDALCLLFGPKKKRRGIVDPRSAQRPQTGAAVFAVTGSRASAATGGA